jgi:hypothetical protein
MALFFSKNKSSLDLEDAISLLGTYNSSDEDISIDPQDDIESVSRSTLSKFRGEFNRKLSQELSLLTKSLIKAIRQKNSTLRKILGKKSIGEVKQQELLKSWAVSLLGGLKEKVELTYGNAKVAIGDRWNYGRLGKKNPFEIKPKDDDDLAKRDRRSRLMKEPLPRDTNNIFSFAI